jgi:glycerophosphoryl diester phosphodiesterase
LGRQDLQDLIDEEDDPYGVSDVLQNFDHQCYGDGITGAHVLGPNVRPSIEHACVLRAERNRLKFIYTWIVNNDEDSRECIRIGVDAMITDGIEDLVRIVQESEFAPIR